MPHSKEAGLKTSRIRREPATPRSRTDLHPSWHRLIAFCKANPFCRLEKLDIRDGLPVSADKAMNHLRFDVSQAGRRETEDD